MLNREAAFFCINNSPILLRAPEKNLSPALSSRKRPFVVGGGGGGGGGGVWIFSGTTHLRFDKVVVSQSKQKHFDIENIHRLNEIPGRKFRAKTWYLHMWKQHIIFSREISPLLWVHDKSRLSQQKLLKWNSLVFCSLRSLVKYFSTLEDKFLTYARPCNILYI